ncbi:MAG: hypothetical protein U0736_09530 [Gemmataceae bacterium]
MTGRRLGERAAWWIYPAVMAALALAPGRSPAEERTTPPREGFGPGKLWQIHLTLPAKEYEAMQPRSSRRGFPWFGGATAKPADPRPVHRNNFGMDLPLATGTVTLDGQTFADVAVRYKGNGTLGDASRTIKKSLKIEAGRGRAVSRAEDDQPALRGGRPVEVPRNARLRPVPRRRRCRPADRALAEVPDGAGQV